MSRSVRVRPSIPDFMPSFPLVLVASFCGVLASCQDAPRRAARPDTSAEHKSTPKPPPPPAPELPRLPPAEPVTLPELKPGLSKQSVQLPNGTTVRYCVSAPAAYDGTAPTPLVMILHQESKKIIPYMGKRMIDDLFDNAFEDLHAVLIAPDSLGGEWTTPENEQMVVWLTRSALMSYPIDQDRVVLSGFASGGTGVWTIGGRSQQLYTAAVPVAGKPRGGADWKIPVYAVHSKMDNKVPIGAVQSEVTKLRSAGVPAEIKELTGVYNEQMQRYTAGVGSSVAWLTQTWKSQPKKPAPEPKKPTPEPKKSTPEPKPAKPSTPESSPAKPTAVEPKSAKPGPESKPAKPAAGT